VWVGRGRGLADSCISAVTSARRAPGSALAHDRSTGFPHKRTPEREPARRHFYSCSYFESIHMTPYLQGFFSILYTAERAAPNL